MTTSAPIASLSQKTNDAGKDQIPGLVRMLLVDSKIFPGSISEIPLDGNTLITGTNAAGKTSIIQLLPLFFGVSPTKISKKQQGKSFYGHYLPNLTSYIAFEYRHRDGDLRSVIIHAAPADDKPMFRFVRSGLFADMFIKDDGKFVASSKLSSHLRDRGYDVADRIIDTLSDYKTIIQGLKPLSSNAKDQRFMAQMVSQYTVSQLRHPLISADSVVYSMLKKDVSLRALQEMIADNLLVEDPDIQIGSDRSNLEKWPTRYNAYQDVMKEEEPTRALQVRCVELQGYQADKDICLSELQALEISLAGELVTKQKTRDAAEQTMTREAEDYAEKKEEAHLATSEARRAKNDIINKIDEIETTKRDNENSGILKKVALADRKPEIEDTLKRDHSRYTALAGEQQELTQRYADLEREAKKYADGETDIIRLEENADRMRHADQTKSAKTRHTASEIELQISHEAPIAEAEEAYSAAGRALGGAEEAAKFPQVPQELIIRHDEAQRTHTDCLERVAEAALEGSVFEKALSKASEDLVKVETEIAGLNRKMSDLTADLVRQEQSKKPNPGSLLAHLRQHRDNWGEDIGRIINPDLLDRTDLAPTEATDHDTLFGMKLDLTHVAPAAAADISEVEDRIEDLKAEMDEVKVEIGRAEVRLSNAANLRTKANSHLTRHKGEKSVLEQKLVSSKSTLASRQREIAEAREKVRELALQHVAAARENELQKKEAVKETREALKSNLESLRASNAAETSEIEASLTAALELHHKRSNKIRSELAARLEGLKKELSVALSQKGIDPELIARLKTSINAAEGDLQTIRRNDVAVQQWRLFTTTRLPLLAGLRSDLKLKEIALDARAAEEGKLKGAWLLRKKVLKDKIDALRTEINRTKKQYDTIVSRLAKFDAGINKPTRTVVRSLDELLASLNAAEQSIKTTSDAIKGGVRSVAGVFTRDAGTPAEQYLSFRKSTFSSTTENEEWVPALVDWFDNVHKQHHEALMRDASTIANDIKSGYHRLKDLDTRIKAENRALQSSLNKNNVITVVQDLNVEITSLINDLEFMPAMERLSTLHEEWMRSPETSLPKGFSEAMASLLVYWSDRRGITANLRDQIIIKGYIIENGNQRYFDAKTDMTDISSNGVSYLVLTTILVGFVNMVRGNAPVHIVWALDELGNIDADNTRKLLDMLGENNITLIAATPSASASINSIFDYRVKVIAGPRLADIKGAGRPSQRLLASPGTSVPLANPPAPSEVVIDIQAPVATPFATGHLSTAATDTSCPELGPSTLKNLQKGE